uniref:Uncharacterized protein n=1 Tax=Tanacetum cinerariifolium TaxID=118510 RepID=A0A6L2KJE0_TANCI|nr:hypothetical protein [Tanacetum cinerariifolium]
MCFRSHHRRIHRAKAKKARRRGRTFNWETATYGKVSYFDDFNYLKDFENEFLAIVYNDALTSGLEILSEPMVRPLDNNEFDFSISLDESDDEDYICETDNGDPDLTRIDRDELVDPDIAKEGAQAVSTPVQPPLGPQAVVPAARMSHPV